MKMLMKCQTPKVKIINMKKKVMSKVWTILHARFQCHEVAAHTHAESVVNVCATGKGIILFARCQSTCVHSASQNGDQTL